MDYELKFIIIIKMYANSVKDNIVDMPCMFDFNYKFENLMQIVKFSLKIKSMFYNIGKVISTNLHTNPVQKESSLCVINL